MSDEQRRTGEQPPTPDEPGHAPTPQGPLEHAQLDDPWLLDRVLAGDAGEQWSSVAELFTAASGPAEADELRGERAAVASFQAARASAAHRREERQVGQGARRVAVVSTLMAGKFAAVTVAGIVTLGAGGMAAAAYTGILPAPLQDVAHRTIGAPLPDRTTLRATPTPTPEPTPSATTADPTSAPSRQSDTSSTTTTSAVQQPARPVADLCADWRLQQLATTGPAFAILTQAAGSTSLDAFCASLTTPTTEPTTAPSGTPTTDPTATPSDTGSPSETSTPSPTTASDSPTTPPMTASDQPTAPPQEPTTSPTDKPTGP